MNAKKLIKTIKYPLVFLLIMWSIKFIEIFYNTSYVDFGVLPRSFEGLKGILFSPIIHKDFNHLINNSMPIIVLGSSLIYFYPEIKFKLISWLYFTSGILLWGIGRESFHIGASGFIYALAGFIFFSGLMKKNKRLSALSLVVVFIYGSMFWGLLPTHENVSWEGHLSGLITGLIIAFFFKDLGPKKDVYQWEIDEEEELKKNKNDIKITYNYIAKK
ncbi:MAG: rhomboid family intramembrane serine protease [Flavobacteriales bacterium]|jgi:membrane associated rhomboid family serine protease|nr:rhomboid family intramembrane serine protease [Flavobacteriales bacterium]|tara:strand:- start:39787 stop:40437 length:651 start_codon:yes stop_codon:yes gene_type:complete